MCMVYFGASDEYLSALETADTVFAFVFLFEAIVKVCVCVLFVCVCVCVFVCVLVCMFRGFSLCVLFQPRHGHLGHDCH
jgi:hypothetical protein